ncbi:hypothetical protein [Pseudoalteromonas umbrosa]|uniref:hypothetical protein n=1 Tax=Pseudoalteromonas umbrosa TaxID=3048489 RepID=UPI0024C3E797|nr:hypothetical protein [Pseudoalteromonas sp. B95]MDK1290190.1 hypothetical protein [Pseudoalteromonas sp. B95]
MTRAQNIIARYNTLINQNSALSNVDEGLEDLVITEAGQKTLSRINSYLKSKIKEFNVMMKWDWPSLNPSLRQLNSDDLEWKVTVNSQSNGEEFVTDMVTWAEGALVPAVKQEFAGEKYKVKASVAHKIFPREDGGQIQFATVTVQLSKLKKAGLVALSDKKKEA